MSVETALVSTLRGDANVAALIGNGDSPLTYRLYPVIASENNTTPYVVYTIVAGVRPQTFSGLSVLENARIQVSVFADTYAGAKVLADYIVTAVDTGMGLGSMLRQTFYEDDTKIHHHLLDFSLWE